MQTRSAAKRAKTDTKYTDMEAKVKATGKIVDVELVCPTDKCGCYTGDNFYLTVYGKEFKPNELDFEDLIDFEERRYELAKAAMQEILSNSDEIMVTMDTKSISSLAVRTADEMIKQLKEREVKR